MTYKDAKFAVGKMIAFAGTSYVHAIICVLVLIAVLEIILRLFIGIWRLSFTIFKKLK